MKNETGIFIAVSIFVKQTEALAYSIIDFEHKYQKKETISTESSQSKEIVGTIITDPIKLKFGFDPTKLKKPVILDNLLIPNKTIFNLFDGQKYIACEIPEHLMSGLIRDEFFVFSFNTPVPKLSNLRVKVTGNFSFNNVFVINNIEVVNDE
jgi:hypothetical protein